MRKTEQIIKELELLEYNQSQSTYWREPQYLTRERQAWIEALKWVLTISPLGKEHEWNHRSSLVK
jgi:hypothetical protein